MRSLARWSSATLLALGCHDAVPAPSAPPGAPRLAAAAAGLDVSIAGPGIATGTAGSPMRIVFTVSHSPASTAPAAAVSVHGSIANGPPPGGSAVPSQGSCSGHVCDLGALPLGASATVAYTLTPPEEWVGHRFYFDAVLTSAGDVEPADNALVVPLVIETGDPKPPEPPTSVWRALILDAEDPTDPEAAPADAAQLSAALKPFYATVLAVSVHGMTGAAVIEEIKKFYATATDTDHSLVYWAGHGGKMPDAKRADGSPDDEVKAADVPYPRTGCAEAANLPCDERIELGKGQSIRDDELTKVFEPVRGGSRVLMFGTCFSGGLVGGTKDLQPGATLAVMMAAGENQVASGPVFPEPAPPKYTLFGAAMAAGLTKETVSSTVASADTDNDKKVTVAELQAFAKLWVVPAARILDRKFGRVREPQTPQQSGAADLVVLDYSGKSDKLVVRPDVFPAPESATKSTDKCECGPSGCAAPNRPPNASAGGPYAASEGATVAFSSAGTADPDGGTLTYRWTFGDGTTSALANPAKAYADNGTYAVQLVVTDAAGAKDTAAATAVVANVAPTATVSASSAITEGQSVRFDLAATDAGAADRATLRYAFDCGLGAGFGAWTTDRSAVCPPVPDQDTITVRGKVRDKDSSETTYAKAIVVRNAVPVVSLGAASFTTLRVGEPLAVGGVVDDAGVNDAPWRYTVSWGDGTPSTTGTLAAAGEPTGATHAYARAGTYRVRMTAADKDNASGSSPILTITVFAPPVPRIVFVGTRDGNEEIYTASPDGSAVTRLTNDPASDRQPVWSPDGTRIAFIRGTGGAQALHVMNADGTGLRPLLTASGARHPAWSRDDRIAFSRETGAIWTIGPDGAGATQLSPFGPPAYDEPAWSPVRGDVVATANGEIVSLGTSGRALTSGGGRSPAWSPDGTRIAFVSTRDGNAEIYVMNAGDGTGLTRLTTHAASDTDPAWSADGTRIAFVSDRDGARDLYVMNADGSGVQRRAVGSASGPAWR